MEMFVTKFRHFYVFISGYGDYVTMLDPKNIFGENYFCQG